MITEICSSHEGPSLFCFRESKSVYFTMYRDRSLMKMQHYLRSEPGVYYQDLYPLVCLLPRYANEGKTVADMLPMWHASEDNEPHRDEDHHFAMPSSPMNQVDSTVLSKESTQSTKDTPSTHWMFSLRRKNKTVFDPEQVLPTVHAHRPLKPSRNPPSTGLFDYFPFLSIFKAIAKPFKKNKTPVDSTGKSNRSRLGRKRKPLPCDSNVPVEISLFLSK